MPDCDFCLIPTEESVDCGFCLTPSSGPTPRRCAITVPWSLGPVTIDRACFLEGLTNEEAREFTHTITNFLPVGATGVFDEFGNFTFTPAAGQKPDDCGGTSGVLLLTNSTDDD